MELTFCYNGNEKPINLTLNDYHYTQIKLLLDSEWVVQRVIESSEKIKTEVDE